MSDQMNTPASLSQELINEFVVAAHFDLPKVQQLLAEKPELLNENADWVETPIQAAAHTNNREIVEFLLSHGAPLDITTAAMLGRFEDVEAMLDEDPEMIDDTGAHNIPLMYFAVIGGSLPIATLLFDLGATLNSPDGTVSPLHGAALFGLTEMAQWLLDNDANPYSVDFEGKSAFDRAKQGGRTEIVALLRPFFPDDTN